MMPANDNLPARSLAEQLTYVLALRNQPDHEPEPLQSNWATAPTELVEPEVRRELHGEQRLEITPSIEEIYREMHHTPTRNDADQIVAIGKLRFSDGTQTEKGFMVGPDGDVVQYDRRMETGAMLGCSERLMAATGSGSSPARINISNTAIAERFGVESVSYMPGKRNRRAGKSYSALESRALIADAIANTAVMPAVTTLPSGLACGTAQVSDQFIGMKIGSTGKGGGTNWQDMGSALEDYHTWRLAHAELSEKDKTVLEVAMTAKTLDELGVRGHRRTKERQAVKRLKAANDNLVAAVKKFG